jgi:hypothetical protein
MQHLLGLFTVFYSYQKYFRLSKMESIYSANEGVLRRSGLFHVSENGLKLVLTLSKQNNFYGYSFTSTIHILFYLLVPFSWF